MTAHKEARRECAVVKYLRSEEIADWASDAHGAMSMEYLRAGDEDELERGGGAHCPRSASSI